MFLRVVSKWLERTLSPANPRMNDRSIAREVGERHFLRDAFGHQHREQVGVGMLCCGDIIAFDELDG